MAPIPPVAMMMASAGKVRTLIERIQQLLAGGSASKSGAIVERATKAAKIEQPFRRAVERYAHAIQQVDDGGSRVAHLFYRRLIREKIAAVNGVIEVLPGGIAF